MSFGRLFGGSQARSSPALPPVKSTDKCSPLCQRKNIARMNVAADITLNINACRMNGMSCLILKREIDPRRMSTQRRGSSRVSVTTPQQARLNI